MNRSLQNLRCAIPIFLIVSFFLSDAQAEDFFLSCRGIIESQSWTGGTPEVRQETKTFRIVDGTVAGHSNCWSKSEKGSFCETTVAAPPEMSPTIRLTFTYNLDRTSGTITESIYQHISVEGLIQKTPALATNQSLSNYVRSTANQRGEVVSTLTFRGDCKKADKPKF